MKQRVILVVVVFTLLLTCVTLAHADKQYRVQNGTSSGQGYRLIGTSWQVSGMASGGDYLLLQPAATELRGSGCCCTYLPMTLCNFRP
jgi:hypothetical protein